MRAFFFVFVIGVSPFANAKSLKTNEINMPNAPDWLTQTRVEKVTGKIQNKLEWATRRVTVNIYRDDAGFEKAQSLGPLALALTKTENGVTTVHLGPRVTNANFDEVFGHELVHVIIVQKYKDAIPKWLEEGLANHLAARGKVDYHWLARQPFPAEITELAHPFKGSAASISYRYKASQALAEMLQKKCELENLIRLSVRREMEKYIKTYCGIQDLNAAFKEWVNTQAK